MPARLQQPGKVGHNGNVAHRPKSRRRLRIHIQCSIIGVGSDMVLAAAVIGLSSALALVASLQRILGRSIPRLRYSPPVPRNRAYYAVPITMTIGFSCLLLILLRSQVCAHCNYTYAWQNPVYTVQSFILALGFSGVVGWIVFAGILISNSIFRLISRHL